MPYAGGKLTGDLSQSDSPPLLPIVTRWRGTDLCQTGAITKTATVEGSRAMAWDSVHRQPQYEHARPFEQRLSETGRGITAPRGKELPCGIYRSAAPGVEV